MLELKKEVMKRATFNMLPSQITRLEEVTTAIKEMQGTDVNKSEVFREALKRGLQSIMNELEVKKENKTPPKD